MIHWVYADLQIFDTFHDTISNSWVTIKLIKNFNNRELVKFMAIDANFPTF